MFNELRHAWRRLRHAPAFTVTALLVLALGLGATTTMFSVVDAVLLEPLPYPAPGRLVDISHSIVVPGVTKVDQSDGTFMLYERHSAAFDAMALYRDADVNLGTLVGSTMEPERAPATAVSAGFFRALGVAPIRGRDFAPGEDRVNAPRQVVILSEGLWRRRFGGDQAIVGKQVIVDGTPRTIVGVMPATFRNLSQAAELWVPLRLDPAHSAPGIFDYKAVGRLKAGVTYGTATADLTRILPRLLEEFPSNIPPAMFEKVHLRPVLTPLRDVVIGDAGRLLWIVFGAVGVLMLIAAANVANLFLVRAEGRQRELAIRTALGAGRRAVLTHYFSEALLLAAAGGVLGILIATSGIELLAALPTGIELPRLHEVRVDGTVLLFAAGLSALCAIGVSIVPLGRARRVSVASALNESGRAATTGAARNRARSALVVAQVALALVLVAASGLMARSFARLRDVKPGFAPDNVLAVRLTPSSVRYPTALSILQFYDRLRGQVSAIPGVAEAAATTWIPLTGDHDASTLGVEDRPPPPNTVPPVHPLIYATSNFLATMGIPILSGRALGPQDPAHPLLEAVVSRAFARRYWGDSSALGRRVRPALVTFAGPWYTVVGVAGDVHFRGLEQPADEAVYFPAMLVRKDSLIVPPGLSLVVRSRNGSSPTAITPEVRQAVRSIDPGLPIYGEQSMASVVHAASARTRFLVVVLALASAMALVLGAVGLYGVMAYGVSLRQREIGVRMALGARPSDVGRMISRQGLMLTGIGVVIGLAGAIAITRFLRGLLYDVSPTDPLTLVATCLVLFVVALVASWLPARRAAAVDPADALRE